MMQRRIRPQGPTLRTHIYQPNLGHLSTTLVHGSRSGTSASRRLIHALRASEKKLLAALKYFKVRIASSPSHYRQYFQPDLLAKNSPAYSAHPGLLQTSATITLLLPDLDGSTFTSANAAYASFFGASPPARACVGVGGVGVGLDCLAWVGEPSGTLDNKVVTRGVKGETGTRKALHVQSLSYWAPANIGPYSQAISVREFFLSPVILPFTSSKRLFSMRRYHLTHSYQARSD